MKNPFIFNCPRRRLIHKLRRQEEVRQKITFYERFSAEHYETALWEIKNYPKSHRILKRLFIKKWGRL